MPIKMQNIYSINLMTILKGLVEKHKLFKHILNDKDSIDLKKIDERD